MARRRCNLDEYDVTLELLRAVAERLLVHDALPKVETPRAQEPAHEWADYDASPLTLADLAAAEATLLNAPVPMFRPRIQLRTPAELRVLFEEQHGKPRDAK